MRDAVSKIIQETYQVPDHIQAIANAIRYDLMHGPSWLLVPNGDVTRIDDDCVASLYDDLTDDASDSDLIEQTYTGIAAQALRDFIDDLPNEVYVDTDCGFVSTQEPEGTWENPEDLGMDDDTDPALLGYETNNIGQVWCEPYTDNTYHCDRAEIVEALFGRTIAREFR